MAINPATEKQIPIYAGDFVLGGYGTGAIFGDVHDERDFVFVKKFNISAKPSIVPEDPVEAQKVLNLEYCFTDYGILVDSGEFTGMKSLDAKEKITDYFIDKGIGSREVNYRLRDWLVSRQRYWGCPIPIVYDPEGNAHAVSEDDLPVLLPTDVDFKPTGESPITRSEDYKKRAEEKYGKGWHYEADTMDTFVDSSWYFFRHTDAKDHTQAFDTEKLNYWLPVDLYMIGAEHTVLHLLYSRFFTKFFYDQGVIKFDEPFYLMRHMGTILGPDGKKMSKRWGNVINPNDEIAKYSADTVRMYEMFMGPLEEAKPWNDRAENGVFRFLSKVWELQDKVNDFEDDSQTIQVNKLVQKVSWDIEHLSFNTSVAKFMEFVNFLGNQEKISKNVWEIFMKLLAPFAPFITEELWSILGYTDSIHLQEWPKFNPDLDQEEDITMAVQVNGKVRGTIIINKSADESEALNLAKTDTNIAKYLVTEPKKVIYVKGRILNIII
jgi:leucyl-tRNA synthetase